MAARSGDLARVRTQDTGLLMRAPCLVVDLRDRAESSAGHRLVGVAAWLGFCESCAMSPVLQCAGVSVREWRAEQYRRTTDVSADPPVVGWVRIEDSPPRCLTQAAELRAAADVPAM